MAKPDEAGRVIAGLLGYNPGPGIYSRLERAIEAMPDNVRVQELPGLLKRYKDGVPGWELKAVDLDSVIGGRPAVPKEELLQAVKERSPVYTHKEVVLADTPPMETIPGAFGGLPHYQDEASAIGRGIAHGDPKYQDYGQGGRDYTEILLTQPGARSAGEYYNHWGQAATQATSANQDAVAHARFDTHGDALRINELQSDLGIHNRKMREMVGNGSDEASFVGRDAETIMAKDRREPDESYIRRMREDGFEIARGNQGGWVVTGLSRGLPFPLEDAWSDILIKRLALEAARKGHRAIEVASPRAIADKVGGNIDNYEHFYGKVVPGALERLGRKMGGLVEDAPPPRAPTYDDAADEMLKRYNDPTGEAINLILDTRKGLRREAPAFAITPVDAFDTLAHTMRTEGPAWQAKQANELYESMLNDLISRGAEIDVARPRAAEAMTQLMRFAEEQARVAASYRDVRGKAAERAVATEGGVDMRPRRYLMSDEMRRRLIQEGVGAAVATGIMSQDDLIDRLNQ